MINFLNTAVDLLLRWRDATGDTLSLWNALFHQCLQVRAQKETRARKKEAVNQNDFTNAVLGHFLRQSANQTKACGIILSELAFECKIVTMEKQSLRSDCSLLMRS